MVAHNHIIAHGKDKSSEEVGFVSWLCVNFLCHKTIFLSFLILVVYFRHFHAPSGKSHHHLQIMGGVCSQHSPEKLYYSCTWWVEEIAVNSAVHVMVSNLKIYIYFCFQYFEMYEIYLFFFYNGCQLNNFWIRK